jgi:hypothetical protein
MQVVEDESASHLANPVFGVGTVPLALDRINWGALVLGPLWALAYGAWGWCVGLIAARVVPFALFYVVPASRSAIPTVIISLGVWALYFVPAVLFAFRANRLAWSAAQRALASPKGQHASLGSKPVASFQRDQRVWAWVGLATLIAAPLGNLNDDYGNLDPTRVRSALFGYAASLAILLVLFAVDVARRKTAVSKLTKVSS